MQNLDRRWDDPTIKVVIYTQDTIYKKDTKYAHMLWVMAEAD